MASFLEHLEDLRQLLGGDAGDVILSDTDAALSGDDLVLGDGLEEKEDLQ